MINAAIVGLGRWGQVLVDSVQGKSDRIRFTRGVTRTPSKAAAYAARCNISLGDDYGAALADPAIDAVVLATPHLQHAEQIAAAAAAGKHVFVEKPFTLSKDSAEHAVHAAEQAGIVLALGHNRRFLPSMAELRRRIASGSLGTILHVETNFSGSGGLRYKPGMWRATAMESPAGGMTGMGIHMVDTMIGLFGRIDSVHAQSFRRFLEIDMDDTTSMLFRFENGMSGYLGTIAATTPAWRVQVFGSEGWAELRDELRLEIRPLEGEREVVEFPKFDKERAELEAFADAVEGKAAYPLPSADAIHGVAVLEAIIQSAKTGETLKIA